ncbi:MAG: alpha/beta hydrolase [Saprospiraceae bacterium]
MTESISRPSFFWLLSEPGRALLELSTFYPYHKIKPKTVVGDGHPVMTLPGFLSSEKSTKILRGFIRDKGYDVYDWGLGRNMGKLQDMELLITRIEEVYRLTGQQISLVGWSLGGVFARQVAKERPHLIRQIITLGSPFSGLGQPNNIAWAYSALNGGKSVKHINEALLANIPIPAPVPTTAIYSKIDGIVPWRFCMEMMPDDIHQNIEVYSSHIGMGVNFSVLAIIEDRLRQQKDTWDIFSPKGLLNNLIVYPSL